MVSSRFSSRSVVTDVKQWEYISYCLSQLTFTEKGMKKLMESFKIYEHALWEDHVMDNFKRIIAKGKKFAKQELKSCVEEFEEKINKFHMEKKEQEMTARNAQVHQQKVSSLEDLVESNEHTRQEDEVHPAEEEATGVVIDPSTEEGTTHVLEDELNTRSMESDENSDVSTVLKESEASGRGKSKTNKMTEKRYSSRKHN